jgi:hypothetical protein
MIKIVGGEVLNQQSSIDNQQLFEVRIAAARK